MRKFHLALSVSDIEACVRDYSGRLGCAPEVIVPNEYALWRTESLNFSIRKDEVGQAGMLRHLGWEDEAADAFSSNVDCNGIVWERFSQQQQAAEIASIWPRARK